MSGEFKNEVFRTYEPNPVQHCAVCGEKAALVRTMLDPTTGRTVRMFKCNCGEQTWSFDKQ